MFERSPAAGLGSAAGTRLSFVFEVSSNVSTTEFVGNVDASGIENRGYRHYRVPTSTIESEGLASAVFDDPSSLRLRIAYLAEHAFELKSFRLGEQVLLAAAVTGPFPGVIDPIDIDDLGGGDGTASTTVRSAYVAGRWNGGDPFGACLGGAEYDVDTFIMGTATLTLEGCEKAETGGSGPAWHQTYFAFTLTDDAPGLPNGPIRVRVADRTELAQYLTFVSDQHHHFGDALHLKVDGAEYAIGLLSEFPDIPAPEGELQFSDRQYAIRYGSGEWSFYSYDSSPWRQ